MNGKSSKGESNQTLIQVNTNSKNYHFGEGNTITFTKDYYL